MRYAKIQDEFVKQILPTAIGIQKHILTIINHGLNVVPLSLQTQNLKHASHQLTMRNRPGGYTSLLKQA